MPAQLTPDAVVIAAAQLAASVMAHVPNQIVMPADGKTLDQVTQAEDLYVWNIFQVFVNGINSILTDPKDWPLPVLPVGGQGGGAPAVTPANMLQILNKILGMLPSGSPAIAEAQQLIALLGAAPAAAPATTPPAVAIPAPGVAATAGS